MFTGIIQDIGNIRAVRRSGENTQLSIATKLAAEISVGDSVAIAGVCLTAETVTARAGEFTATAVAETLTRTTVGTRTIGDRVNLELALRPNDRLGGHFVQGHVDALGQCERLTQQAGSWILVVSYPRAYAELLVEKGSIALDGVSLTAYEVGNQQFQVSIIPHTWAATTLSELQPGSAINLEFDILGKYVQRRNQTKGAGLTWETFERYGY